MANQIEVSRAAKREVQVFALGICSNQLLSLDTSVFYLGLAMEGGDGDRLYRGVQTELEALIEATRASFDRLSRALTAHGVTTRSKDSLYKHFGSETLLIKRELSRS